MLEKKEKLIKEQRILEATKKNLVGLEGKIGCIVKNLGEPMIAHGAGDFVTYNYYFEEEDEEEIPTADDVSTLEIGKFYYGLNRGMDLDIKYIYEDKELIVKYKGVVVYKEFDNDLEIYFPMQEWENMIQILYNSAKKKDYRRKIELKKEQEQEIEQDKKSFLKEMFRKWGFK